MSTQAERTLGSLGRDATADLETVWRFLRAGAPIAARCDAIFAFGSANLGVPRTASRLFADGVAPWVVVTGGGSAGGPTEAERYAHILRRAGVPDDRIVVEPEATNTEENVRFGMRAAAANGIRVRSATVVAFPSSLRRSAATFRWHFPAVRLSACPAFAQLGQYEAPTEEVAAVVLAEIDRLETYPERGYFAAQTVPSEVTAACGRLRAALGSESRLAHASGG